MNPFTTKPTCNDHSLTMKKALIPAAGLGTRMFPATKIVKKELLPVITPDGFCKPILQTIIEEAVDAGAEDVGIIVRPEDLPVFQQLFSQPADALYNRLPDMARSQCDNLVKLGQRVTFIQQHEQLGFGHAVLCAQAWAGDDPVLLLLGDHVFCSTTAESCSQQLIHAYEQHPGHPFLSLYQLPGDAVRHYGTATGHWINADKDVLQITAFMEKPTHDYARQNLSMPGLPEDTFLCVYGQYILTPDVFQILERQVRQGLKVKGEFQLTPALEELCREQGLYGFMVQGEHYDTGQPREYLKSLVAYASLNP